jgi:hypothetical protein
MDYIPVRIFPFHPKPETLKTSEKRTKVRILLGLAPAGLSLGSCRWWDLGGGAIVPHVVQEKETEQERSDE